ncbi:ABC transporter permease [Vibrio lentus]|uniref:ABC transporter permease n=1 Tax=Vibrio TaxID=662 RepID=UPI001F5306D3|nr:ABC transporter permease [Vibrio lentus]
MKLMNRNSQYLIDLIYILTRKEIKVRYKNSFFGYLWSLANPLCFALIYYTAFKVFMRVEIENYTQFLICGLFAWQWMANSITMNLFSYVGNSQIIKKTCFPRSILPFSTILMEGFNFFISIPIILLFLYFSDMAVYFKSYLLWIPVLSVIQIMIAYGLSLTLATLNLFFRDIERFVQLGLMMLFYATPILYIESMIPEEYQWLIDYNPLAKIAISWRNLFLYGTVDIGYILSSLITGIVCMFVGSMVFNKLKYRFAEVL